MINLVLFALVIIICIAVVSIVGLIYRNKAIDFELSRSYQEKQEFDAFLIKFSQSLATADGLKESMNSICRHAAIQVGAEAAAIYELRDNELVATGIYGHYTLIPSKNLKLLEHTKQLHEAVKICRFSLNDGSLVGNVAGKEIQEIIYDGSSDKRFINTLNPAELKGILCEPMIMDNRIFGVMVLVNNQVMSGMPFDDNQIKKAEDISTQVVLMCQLVHSYNEMNLRDRLEQEIDLARQIQMSLLPKSFPEWAQFSINAFTRPAKEVNGDFYDFVQIDEDRLLIVIADASGKGVPASMVSAMTRSFIRAMADNFSTLSDFLSRLNDKIYSDTDDGRFITLNCCLLDKKNSLLEFGRAGHTELITFVHNHLRVIFPEGSGLGIMPSEFSNFDTFCLAFEPGMSFLLFSDGITEAVNSSAEEFGLERLKELFESSIKTGLDADQVIKKIFSAVKNFSTDQADDQTVILIQYI